MLRRISVIMLCIALGAPALADDDARRIAVSGEGRVEAAPDLAVVTAGVETEAATATEALAANSAAMATVMAALAEAGIAPADIQTSQISLNPVWNDPGLRGTPGAPEISGYAASNLVTIRVRALDSLGAVLDRVATAGANRIQGIGFSVAEPGALRDEARRAAVADARARAELYAAAAGVTLGEVVEISESFVPEGPLMLRAQMAEMAMDVPVSGGSVAISAQVGMVFGIAD